jgi:GAF domain-containing protein
MTDQHSRNRRGAGWGLQPLPETRDAINELEPFGEEENLLEQLLEQGRKVRELVPDCVGLSLAWLADQITFTLVSSDLEVALLDGLQYVADGPCVAAVRAERVVTFDHDESSSGAGTDPEAGWLLFAQGTAAAGVRSTLTLPVLRGGSVVGSVNLYARSSRAFEGWHDQVAAIFAAWGPGAVTNADLSFSTRIRAQAAPAQLRAEARIAAATGILAALRGLDVEAARRVLRDAAVRAGVAEVQLAEVILKSHADRSD